MKSGIGNLKFLIGSRFHRISQAGYSKIVDGFAEPDSASGLGVAARLLQPLGRVIAVSGHPFVVLADPITHVNPSVGVHSKMRGAGGWVDRQWERLRLVEDVIPLELPKDRAGQRDVSPQCRMVRIVDHMVADQSIGADCNQFAPSIDQDAASVPLRDLLNSRAKGSLATERQSVVIESGQVMQARLLHPAPSLQQTSQTKMRFGEPRVPLQDRRVLDCACTRIERFEAAGRPKLTDQPPALIGRHGWRNRRPARLIPRLIGRRDDQDRQCADLVAIRDECLESAAEIVQNLGRLHVTA